MKIKFYTTSIFWCSGCSSVFAGSERLRYVKKSATALIFLILLLAGTPVQGAVTIDSLHEQLSSCANNGIITVYAHSNSDPILYGIISGPVTRPFQSSSQIGGLPAGTYQVMAVDFSGDTVYANAVVGGNYKFPDFTLTYSDLVCPNKPTGVIVGTPIAGTGHEPYSWELTQESTGTVTTQFSDTFSGLIGGTYSLRIYDSCQSYTTRSVALIEPIDSFLIDGWSNEVVGCDSLEVLLELTYVPGQVSNPITVNTSVVGGSFHKTYTYSVNESMDYDKIYLPFPVGYGSTYRVTITDACGFTQTSQSTIPPFSAASAQVNTTKIACSNEYNIQVGLPGNNMHVPLVLVINSLPGGLVVDSSVTNDTIGTIGFVYSDTLSPGTYKVTLRDTCGNVFMQDVTISPAATLPPPNITESIAQNHCLDSVAAFNFNCNNFLSPVTLKFLSGPTNIHSTKAHFAYTDSLVYGETYQSYSSSGTTQFFTVSNLAVGTYVFEVYDSCGNTVVDSLTVYPQDLLADQLNDTYTKGCLGQGTINLFFQQPGFFNETDLTVTDLNTGMTVASSTFFDSTYVDTLYNVGYDTYAVQFRRIGSEVALLNIGPECQDIYDTLSVPPYTQPAISYATVIKCNGQLVVILTPDSNSGLAPYQYALINGPQTEPRQESNIFYLTQKGTYIARVNDTCGNAQTYTFVVDTVSAPTFVVNGSTCIGSSAILIAQGSPYFTYTWQRPDGSIYIGDSLEINPVTISDTGLYNISRIDKINGCSNTSFATFTLNGTQQTFVSRSICTGQSFTMDGYTYTQTGIYRDTILTAGCDSIIVLNLNVTEFLSDSVVQNICSGQGITVGAKTYTQTGIYRDTFPTSSCDSIFILNLAVNPPGYDSVLQSICNGQSVTVGTHTYNQTGIYRDTLSSSLSGCDSIHVLNLTVGTFLYDSTVQTICTGQSVTVGTHVYNTTGIYRDTIGTVACDSVLVLNLSVGSYKYDSIAESICDGQSFKMGLRSYSQPGVYHDTLSTTGCDSIVVLQLKVNPLPVLVASSDQSSVTSGEKVNLSASPGDLLYQWTPADLLNDATVQNPVGTVTVSIWFVVIGIDTSTLCSGADSVFINVVDSGCNETKMFVPNAFTPNGDKHNDFFMVYYECPFKQFNIKIFDRWGEKMFESDDQRFAWNGIYKGELLTPAVFVYVIEATTTTGNQVKYEGSVTLLR